MIYKAEFRQLSNDLFWNFYKKFVAPYALRQVEQSVLHTVCSYLFLACESRFYHYVFRVHRAQSDIQDR